MISFSHDSSEPTSQTPILVTESLMTQSSFDLLAPTLHIVPLALVVASRLLLTEQSSALAQPRLAAAAVDSPAIRALPARPMQGYDHYGIND